MKTESSLPWIRKSIYSALTFFGTLIVLSVAYAAYQTITSIEYAPWATLTSSLMTKIVGNVDDLNTRMNGITTSTGQIRPEVLPFKKGQIVGSGSVILTGATANSNTGYYQVEELEANRNLISTSVHWGIGKSQVGTMSPPCPTSPTGQYTQSINLIEGSCIYKPIDNICYFNTSGVAVNTACINFSYYANTPTADRVGMWMWLNTSDCGPGGLWFPQPVCQISNGQTIWNCGRDSYGTFVPNTTCYRKFR